LILNGFPAGMDVANRFRVFTQPGDKMEDIKIGRRFFLKSGGAALL
jgi:hypothetical protein